MTRARPRPGGTLGYDRATHRVNLEPQRRATVQLWLMVFAAWTFLAAFSSAQSAVYFVNRGRPVPLGEMLPGRFADWYTCALFTPLFVWLAQRYPIDRRSWRTTLPLTIAVTSVCVVLKYSLLVSVYHEHPVHVHQRSGCGERPKPAREVRRHPVSADKWKPAVHSRRPPDVAKCNAMGLLNDNLQGYVESAPIEQAAKMRGNLLLIHSMMDDNVHPQNTMQLLTALTTAGRDAELRIYPPGRHGAAYDAQSFRLIRQVTDRFLARNLKAPEPPKLQTAR